MKLKNRYDPPYTMNNLALSTYSRKEELLHGLTHGLGIVFSIAAMVILFQKAYDQGSTSHYVSYIIYCGSLFALYSASTCYHLIHHKHVWWKAFLKKLDHICIYLLIAGTYTPFLLINFRNSTGHILMTLVWSLAGLGILYKVFSKNNKITISLITYLGMGWLAFFARETFIKNVPQAGIDWIIIGGLTYTLGAVFYACKRMPYHHVIWHLFVLGGSVSHFLAVYYSFI